MSIERTAESLPDMRATRVGLSITASMIVTDEAVARGGDVVMDQADERLRTKARADALAGLGIAADAEAALGHLRGTVERMMLDRGALDYSERLALDGAFEQAIGVICR